jgi:hypothetical protein
MGEVARGVHLKNAPDSADEGGIGRVELAGLDRWPAIGSMGHRCTTPGCSGTEWSLIPKPMERQIIRALLES